MHAKLDTSTVLDLSLSMPFQGAWTCDVSSDSDFALSGTLDLVFNDVTVLRGTVVSGEVTNGRFVARLVGGKGKLASTVTPKYYENSPLILPLRELVEAMGEDLDPSCSNEPSLLTNTSRWMRQGGSVGACLDDLTNETGLPWRVTPSGSIWIGQDAYTAFASDHSVFEDLPRVRAQVLACDGLVFPGLSIDGREVHSVTHHLTKKAFRTTVHYG